VNAPGVCSICCDEHAAQASSATNGADKARLELVRKVVTMRDRQGLSWVKIGAALKLAEDAETAKAGASRAYTLYRLVKGQDADTGSLPKKPIHPVQRLGCGRGASL